MKAFEVQSQEIQITSSQLDAPIVTYLPREKRWQLEESYHYQDNKHQITVPNLFRFDLASVPRLFWRIIAPFELSMTAPLIHDLLYRYRGKLPSGFIDPPKTYSRLETDQLFRAIMDQEGISAWRRVLAYYSVRWFGWLAWRK